MYDTSDDGFIDQKELTKMISAMVNFELQYFIKEVMILFV